MSDCRSLNNCGSNERLNCHEISSMSDEVSNSEDKSFVNNNGVDILISSNDIASPLKKLDNVIETKITLPTSFSSSPLLSQPNIYSSTHNSCNESTRTITKCQLSPAHSASSGCSPTNSNAKFAQLSMLPFYDSEEEGPGSLVFLDNLTIAGSHHQPGQQELFSNVIDGVEKGSIAKQVTVMSALGKDKNLRSTIGAMSPSILPYQQRRKIALREDKVETLDLSVEKKTPFFPRQDLSTGMREANRISSVQQSYSSFAEKYKVAPIPPFRGADHLIAGGANYSNIRAGEIHTETGALSPRASCRKALEGNSDHFCKRGRLSPSSDHNRPPLAVSNSSKQYRTPAQEGYFPPPPYQTSTPPPTNSPLGGYHVRVSSQSSISSLGSNAVDSVQGDKYLHQPQIYYANTQNYIFPKERLSNYYDEYVQKHEHGQIFSSSRSDKDKPKVNYNDVLGRDIASFLHGERIAAAATTASSSKYDQSICLWIPSPHGSVPNMTLYRARLPSMNEDDDTEEKFKVKREDIEYTNIKSSPIIFDWEYAARHETDATNQYEQNLRINTTQAKDDSRNPYERRDYLIKKSQHTDETIMRNVNKKYQKHRASRDSNLTNERSALLLQSGALDYIPPSVDNNRYGYTEMNYDTVRRKLCEENLRVMDKSYIEDCRRKRKKEKRRREKEKRRAFHQSESSGEEDFNTNVNNKSKNSKERRYRRKFRRNSALDETLSDTYPESLMSESLTDKSRANVIHANMIHRVMISTKLLLSNLPLSASAISFSIVLLGMLWFKWAEEILTSCKEVTFHSSQCTLPDFPGCYFCDEFNSIYRMVTYFHSTCSYVGGVSVMLHLVKAILSWRSFIDEMSSPTTSSPAGLVFMTMALAFVGKGDVGKVLVTLASFLHLVLVVWFSYMCLAYQTMSDPGWFPNTIGIGLCAVKVWFYYPWLGHFFIAITLMLVFLYYPISLLRVAMNKKMSATICWMQMICPAVALYSVALIFEPSFREERPDISNFQAFQRSAYMHTLTCLFTLCVIGMISSVHGILTRLEQISKEEFSPAHAAYSFPLLLHAIAVQSYRSALDFFAGVAMKKTLKAGLHLYFVVLLISGSFFALICIILFIAFLPKWTMYNFGKNEKELPAPNETTMYEYITYGESLIQHYVSPPILQANETGVLILSYDDNTNMFLYVRTRRVLPALGFEPMMRHREFAKEWEVFRSLTKQDVIPEGEEDCEEPDNVTE